MKNYKLVFVCKSIFCVGVFLTLMYRFDIFPFLSNEVLSSLSTVITSVIIVFVVLFFYRSICDFVEKTDGSNKGKTKSNKKKNYKLNDLIEIIKREDIIDIEIISRGEIIKIGASSDYNQPKDKFFDKLYYINDKEYNNIEEFYSELIPKIADDESVPVLSLE